MPEEFKKQQRELHADLIALRRTWRRLTAAIVATVIVVGIGTWRFVDYATCTTGRTNALSGPGNNRINLFFQAYTEAAGDVEAPLTDGRRSTIIAGLDAARAKYQVIPAHAQLVKDTDFQILAFRDLIAALRANDAYQSELVYHPVCTLWSL